MPDDLHTFVDMSDATLAEDVQFFKTDVFSNIHVELGGGKAFWWQVESSIAGDGLFGDQDSAGMDAPDVGEIGNLSPVENIMIW